MDVSIDGWAFWVFLVFLSKTKNVKITDRHFVDEYNEFKFIYFRILVWKKEIL